MKSLLVLDVTNVILTLSKRLMVVSCRTDWISTFVLSFSNQFWELMILYLFSAFFIVTLCSCRGVLLPTKCSKQLLLWTKSKTIQPTHIPYTSLVSEFEILRIQVLLQYFFILVSRTLQDSILIVNFNPKHLPSVNNSLQLH